MGPGSYDLEEIRRRADIVEVISPHVALRRAGRRMVGLCPFHEDRAPSFTVDPESGLWHCFGCKAGGDLFRFVEMIEKLTFPEAVEMLARRLGVAPRAPAEAARRGQRDRLLALHAEAARWFQAQLGGREGARAREYLQGRGLTQEVIEAYGIGFAPEAWDRLLGALASKGFKGPELARAGLAVAREGGFYDRFRNRVIFPIRDAMGRTIAFGGRALAEDQQPKYLNSPETPLFQKGRTLYALDRARKAMAEAGRAVVVEGYLDAIACHEAGLGETVATMGTALTAEHVELLRRRAKGLVLAFDADSAGLAAALRGRELFERAGLSVRVATLPEGADPDRVLREQGAEALRGLVEDGTPIVEWQLRRVLARADGKGPRERAEALDAAVALLARVPAGADRQYYLDTVTDYALPWIVHGSGVESDSRRTRLHEELQTKLVQAMARARTGHRQAGGAGAGEPPAPEGGEPAKPPPSRLEAGLLAAFLGRGELFARWGAELEEGDFATEGHRRVFAAISRVAAGEGEVSLERVLAALEPEHRGALAELAVAGAVPERIEESVASAVRRLREGRLRRREGELRRLLEAAESEGQREAVLAELTELRRRRSELAGERIIGDS